jgi:tetratricopeptide (TPR) repeat protein
VGDLAALPEGAVITALGNALGHHLYALAWARDERPVVPDVKPKSVGHEETFATDPHTLATLEPELVRMSDSVGARLRKAGLQGRTVQLKVRFHDFNTITRSETVATAVDEGPVIARVARRLLDRLEARLPDDPRILVAAATLDREAGRPEPAAARLARAQTMALAPDVRRAVSGELDALGDPAGAASLLKAGPQDDTTYMLRAAWLVDANDTAGLAALDAEIQAAGLNPARRLLLGQIAEVRSAWADAERWYRSVDAGPERDRARLRLAVAIEKAGRPDEAIAWLQSVQGGGDMHGESLRDAYLQEGEARSRRPDDAGALAAYARGLAEFADDAVLLYARAMHHVRSDRIDDALADLRRIIDRNPDNAEALNAYGYTLAEHRRRYAEALPYVEKSNRLQPGSAATLDSLGWIRLKLGQRSAALVLLRDAWSRDEDPEIAAHLGEALWLSGERDEARRIWARGRELDADNRALRAILEKYTP